MPFPLSYEHHIEVTFNVRKHTLDNLLNNIEFSLKKAKAKNIRNDRNNITFTGGIFRPVTNLNILGPVSSGRITVEKYKDKLRLKYYLKFTEMLLIVTAAVSIFLGPVICYDPNLTIVSKIAILAFAWCWLFGGNYLITIFRFPSFIKKMAQFA